MGWLDEKGGGQQAVPLVRLMNERSVVGRVAWMAPNLIVSGLVSKESWRLGEAVEACTV